MPQVAPKNIIILGSTGSIGVQTLDIVRQHPDKLKVVGLAAQKNAKKLLEQAQEFGNPNLALMEPNSEGIPSGMSAVEELACLADAHLVVVCVAGVIGLLPTLAAIRAGKQIALASKEVLVAAGEIVMPLTEKYGITLTPIDSEHSAIFQCLQGYRLEQVDQLILTASGGPFRGKHPHELEAITPEEALNHPTWRMGGKITVDSATLMNKGLETIEAKWLFGLEVDQVQVVIHPQSIIHSFVRFKDTSMLAQMGWPDMRLPIQYALLYPERKSNQLRPWDPLDSPSLTFEPVDEQTFRCLPLARECSKIGGTMPCVMNAANEEAANAFLRGECGFLQIPELVEETMEKHQAHPVGLEAILETDRWARETARSLIQLKQEVRV